MSTLERVCEGCGAEAGEACRPGCLPLSDVEARLIAADWHGGQWTALYALASTGVPILYRDGCLACEVQATLREVADAAAEHPQHAGELSALAYWIEEWAADEGIGGCE